MTELLVVGVVAAVVIAAAAVFGPRLGVAAPLVLVVVGIVASLVPWVPNFTIEPDWILEGVLPPLLYSSAVSMPAMNFRREFGAISGLSVLLVVGSALVLGVFFMLFIPGLGFAWGVALGAIISPTDAVATSIIKQHAVSKRVVAILDGESLLNDATALVLLKTAITAAAAAVATFSFWDSLGTFVYSVVIAVIIGAVVGYLGLFVRKRIKQPAVNTVLSFTVPFLASVPVEILGGSGLVAAVVAGIITGIRAPRVLSPQSRLSDSQNWQTVELLLEGAVFLTMGLQLSTIISDVQKDHTGIGAAAVLAVVALLLTLAVRAVYVVFLLAVLRWRRRSGERMQPRLQQMSDMRDDPDRRNEILQRFEEHGRTISPRQLAQFSTRITRSLADIDYFLKEPLGWREGTVVVWAGMRGAVTVAAAQTLPEGPFRSLMVLVAFGVAGLSLIVQGGTIGPLLRVIGPKPSTSTDLATVTEDDERSRLRELLRAAGETVPVPADGMRSREYALARVDAERTVLLDARDDGTFDAELLATELQSLDAMQITLELRAGSPSAPAQPQTQTPAQAEVEGPDAPTADA
jgi:monovalent cation/hydrogen antiporter